MPPLQLEDLLTGLAEPSGLAVPAAPILAAAKAVLQAELSSRHHMHSWVVHLHLRSCDAG